MLAWETRAACSTRPLRAPRSSSSPTRNM
jgi:hypothetical protein